VSKSLPAPGYETYERPTSLPAPGYETHYKTKKRKLSNTDVAERVVGIESLIEAVSALEEDEEGKEFDLLLKAARELNESEKKEESKKRKREDLPSIDLVEKKKSKGRELPCILEHCDDQSKGQECKHCQCIYKKDCKSNGHIGKEFCTNIPYRSEYLKRRVCNQCYRQSNLREDKIKRLYIKKGEPSSSSLEPEPPLKKKKLTIEERKRIRLEDFDRRQAQAKLEKDNQLREYQKNYSAETKNVNDKINKISENLLIDPKVSTYLKKNDKGLGVYANKDFKENEIVAFYLVKIYDLKKIGTISTKYLIDLNNVPNLHEKYRKNKRRIDIVGDICDKSFQEPIKLNDDEFWLTAFWGFLCNEPSSEETDNCTIEFNNIDEEIEKHVIIDRDIIENASEYYLISIISKEDIKKDTELTWCYGNFYDRDYTTSCYEKTVSIKTLPLLPVSSDDESKGYEKKVSRKTLPRLPVSSDDESKGDEHELDGRKKIDKSIIHRKNNSKNHQIKYKKKLPSKKRSSKKRSSKKRSSKKRSSKKRSSMKRSSMKRSSKKRSSKKRSSMKRSSKKRSSKKRSSKKRSSKKRSCSSKKK